jgi:hypothetical protein
MAYSPDEARDEDGKWSSGGSSARALGSKGMTELRQRITSLRKDLGPKADANPEFKAHIREWNSRTPMQQVAYGGRGEPRSAGIQETASKRLKGR